MYVKPLWIIGALIFLVLGTIHLYYTFYSDKFSSSNSGVIDEMHASSPNISRETTLWAAWIGFNASHSSGAMFIGMMNIYLVYNYYTELRGDVFFFAFNILTVAFYLWLARKYWFSIPFYGILGSLVCFIAAFLLMMGQG